jgi:hypothetical protein
MARKLRTYQTSMGFFDEAIAAPSMKAALEATMSKPGVILRRPVGSSGPFKEQADSPRHLSLMG